MLGGSRESRAADVRGDNEHAGAIEWHMDKMVAAQNNRDMRDNGHRMVWMRVDALEWYAQDDNHLHILTLLGKCSSV